MSEEIKSGESSPIELVPTPEQREQWQGKKQFAQKLKFGIEVGIPQSELLSWANEQLNAMRTDQNPETQFTLWRLLGNMRETFVQLGFSDEDITNIRETVGRELYEGLLDTLNVFEFFQAYETPEEQENDERVLFELCQLAARVAKSIYGVESNEAREIGRIFVAKA